jgi:hypothetical protein
MKVLSTAQPELKLIDVTRTVQRVEATLRKEASGAPTHGEDDQQDPLIGAPIEAPDAHEEERHEEKQARDEVGALHPDRVGVTIDLKIAEQLIG